MQDLPEDLLDSGATFIAVPRRVEISAGAAVSRALSNPAVTGDTDSDSFYIAVRRDRLDRRYFLSAYLKQLYLDPINSSANPFTLGTRVVSFKLQNDKLFVRDSSDAYKATEVFDNEILVEAYPVVSIKRFNDLRGSSNYVLFDPAAGLNRFTVSTGDIYSDPFLGNFGSFPMRVGLAYSKAFRQITDGVTFEQVITGDFNNGGELFNIWATLGLSIRDYKVGDGYTPTPAPDAPHYFLSWDRLVTGTPFITSDPVRWNLRPGRPPIPFYIGAGAIRAQADFPDVDILGAMKRGIENWNAVLGYEAFRVIQSDRDDLFAQDDKNVVIVDYPGVDAGFAFADWRHNPNNGEILGASIYFDSIWFNILDGLFGDGSKPGAGALLAGERPPFRTLVWGGMPARTPACIYTAPGAERLATRLRAQSSELTPSELKAEYLEHVLGHEFGHVLGLRHNFAGSLMPISSSVMEYVDDLEAPFVSDPQAYDIEAVRYLYQLTDEPPSLPFCTDGDLAFDPNCAQFDIGEQPLFEFWGPTWDFIVQRTVDDGVSFSNGQINYYLNGLLAFARRPPTVEDGVTAIELALARLAPPLDGVDAARAARINNLTSIVVRRLYLDADNTRGAVRPDPANAEIQNVLDIKLRRILTNVDGIRSYAVRRTVVDVLKDQQSLTAYTALLSALAVLRDALPANPADSPELFDLVNRVERAVTPYFN